VISQEANELTWKTLQLKLQEKILKLHHLKNFVNYLLKKQEIKERLARVSDLSENFSIDDVFPLEAFETIQKVVEKAQKEFPITPYIDGKAIAALKKSLESI
jgi:hypothetical protein